MIEYQNTLWNGIKIVDVKKNLVKKTPPPHYEDIDVLEYVSSIPLVMASKTRCEKCELESANVARHLVTAQFSRSLPIVYLMCHRHNDQFLDTFAPFVHPSSNTGTTLRVQPKNGFDGDDQKIEIELGLSN